MILLIKPEPAHNIFSLDMALKNEPLELEYISAALKEAGFDVYLYEASTDALSLDQLLDSLQPEIAAVTGYITQEYLMKDYIKRIKEKNPRTITIAGGSHAQLNPGHFEIPELDYICRSEDVFAICKLAEYHLRSKAVDFASLNGLCYQDNGKWRQNPLKPFDISLLPFPDRTLFYKNIKQYRYLDVSPVALMKTSTSCPFQCSFCYGTALNTGKYMRMDVDRVIAELSQIDCPNIQFVDDDFLFNPQWLKEFIEKIEKAGIKKTYIAYARADFIKSEPELVKDLIRVGFQYFMVGLEAANDDNLNAYNKKTSVNINETCVQLIHNAGAKVVGLFIVDIHFKVKDFKKMRRWIHEQGITYTGISIYTPIPGTPLYEEWKDRLTTHDMEKWDFMHLVVPPVHLSRAAFYFHYYLLVMDLFRIAKRAGIYSFLNLDDYKSVFRKLLLSGGR